MATIYLRNVPEELHRQAKSQAALEGVSLQGLVLKLIEDYLKAAKKKGGK
jgi:predicted HicB family RNase H-like nuclease